MKHNITIRRYTPGDEHILFAMIEREGEEWAEYWRDSGRDKYKKALSGSITYLLFEDEELCGYSRCRDDDGFGVYICDLLVDKKHRGKEYGRLLMEQPCLEFPNDTVYVMGDVHPYYEDKLGYAVEGKIYIVKKP